MKPQRKPHRRTKDEAARFALVKRARKSFSKAERRMLRELERDAYEGYHRD